MTTHALAEPSLEAEKVQSNLVFKTGDYIDMTLLHESRTLIHTGRLLHPPEVFECRWTELLVLLFDNYLVMTKPMDKKQDDVMKYQVYRKPIPLELLTIVDFTGPPMQRGDTLCGLLSGTNLGPASPDSTIDAPEVFPCTIRHNGRLGGLYTIYADSSYVQAEWKQKLEEAIELRKVFQELNKVFEVKTLDMDTFLLPSSTRIPNASKDGISVPGKVTCSVPFNTPDGRALLAVGCAEGVWIGSRYDSRSMRRVLHLKMVTQCAMLEDFGIFLVLADKSLFAYRMEALVPSSPQSPHTSQTPQKLNGTSDVHFFCVGTLHGRTLVIYMEKKHLESIFRVLEPLLANINERTYPPARFAPGLGFCAPRSEWFRIYRDFRLPSESYDLIFLKAKIAILCVKGFEIMDLTDFRSVTIPQRDDPCQKKLAKRCDSCRPLGMFRLNDDEFILCYDEFGLYVDKHGDTSRSTGAIEWEGTAERVALHYPYILLFDNRFIEVRHLETGHLAQIILGHDVRCLWDERRPWDKLEEDGYDHRYLSKETRVHAVATDPEFHLLPGSQLSKAISQHVFELTPVV